MRSLVIIMFNKHSNYNENVYKNVSIYVIETLLFCLILKTMYRAVPIF